MIRWVVLIISLIISSFCFLSFAYNTWMTATPIYDPDLHRVFSLIWLCAALVSSGVGGMLFFSIRKNSRSPGVRSADCALDGRCPSDNAGTGDKSC